MTSEQRSRGVAISPESPPDKSYFNTVRGLIQVVQQGVSSSAKTEDREPIAWLKFEQLDNLDRHSDRSTPLLLFIGYLNGLQMWTIDTVHSGLATEVLSLRQDPVKLACLVRSPRQDIDRFAGKRPLIAVCDSNSRKRNKSPPYGSVKFRSLRCGEELTIIHTFNDEVLFLSSSHRVFVVALAKEIHVFDSGTLQRRFQVSKCHPPPSPGVQPVALGSRWLAYADRKLTFHYQSQGGVASDTKMSYTSSVISAASQSFSYITEKMGKLTGGFSPPREATDKMQSGLRGLEPNVPGIVSIVDILRAGDKVIVEKEDDGEAIVSHFEAHRGQSIQAMSFDPSGQLIITACKLGHDFHVFRLSPHPTCPALGSVHHLYILHRGETTATVQNIAFTFDSRWVSVSSLRGTTHVFPITAYGGAVNKRTHTGVRVVNRLSRYHTSAGLGEKAPTSQDTPSNTSHLPQTSPSAISSSLLLNQALQPKPVTVTALAKIRSRSGGPTSSTSTSTATSSLSQDTSTSSTLANLASSTAGLIYSTETVCVAAVFARSVKRHRRSSAETSSPPRKPVESAVDSLFCVGPDGVLMEYHLQPQAERNSSGDPSSAIELDCQLVQQWCLQRSSLSVPLMMPLSSTSPLILACQEPDHRALAVGAEQFAESTDDDTQNTKWLANIEIYTHEPPARRLWMGPQFKFKTYKTSQGDGGLSAGGETADFFGRSGAMIQPADDSPLDPSSLELQSLNMQQSPAASSAPIATPHRSSHLQCRETDIVLDAGPCSLDKTQLEICSSSPSDREKYTNRELNEKMEKSLADAMEDLDLSPGSGNIDLSSGLPTVASITVTPVPGPSFHSSSAPHHAMPSPPRSSRRMDTNPMLK